MTGIGESILKAGGGAALLALLIRRGPDERARALQEFLDRVRSRFSGEVGFVGIDEAGQPFAAHSSVRMLHGLLRKGEQHVADVGSGFFDPS